MEAAEQIPVPFDISGGYYPSASLFPPPELWNTIRAGANVWLRQGNKLQGANGSVQLSATNVGARIFPFNDSRAEIAGGLVSGRLPFAGLIRLPGGVIMFVSELTSQQVYVNETALSGVTTSSSAGILRLAIPDGVGGYNVYDAGFDPPILDPVNVTTAGGGLKGMAGPTQVGLCAWRTTTDAISAPSNLVTKTLVSGDIIGIGLPSPVSGQDGWIFAGSQVGAGPNNGIVKVVRYVRIFPRGTFTLTNGSGNITAGVGTFFQDDLFPGGGDIVTLDDGSHTILTVTGQGTATMTPNYAGVTGAGKTMQITDVRAEWYDGELGRLLSHDVFKPLKCAGIFKFLDRVILFGSDRLRAATATSDVTGPAAFVLLKDNPEHIGLDAVSTTEGDDILNMFPSSDDRSRNAYMITKNTVEIVTVDEQGNYQRYIKHKPGCSVAKACIPYKDRLYGFAQRPFRTSIDSDTDVVFGIPVFSDMDQWVATRVTLGIDAKNEAVLYAQYDGSTTTKVIPWMTQIERWGPSILITGQVTDWVTVNGVTYAIVLTGGNYRAYTWEGGGGASGAFIGTQYINNEARWKLRRFQLHGYVTTIRWFVATPTQVADVNNTTGADATFTFSTGGNSCLPEQPMNLPPGRGVAARLDFPVTSTSLVEGVFQKLTTKGFPLEAIR